jgi:hypothetical protein
MDYIRGEIVKYWNIQYLIIIRNSVAISLKPVSGKLLKQLFTEVEVIPQ